MRDERTPKDVCGEATFQSLSPWNWSADFPIVNGIPDSRAVFQDSKGLNSEFHKQIFSESAIRISVHGAIGRLFETFKTSGDFVACLVAFKKLAPLAKKLLRLTCSKSRRWVISTDTVSCWFNALILNSGQTTHI